jgi:hypothetical protein
MYIRTYRNPLTMTNSPKGLGGNVFRQILCSVFGGYSAECRDPSTGYRIGLSVSPTCSNIADAFCCGPGSIIKEMERQILQSDPVQYPDSYWWSLYDQACAEYWSALSRVPGCGARSAAERPCRGRWTVPSVVAAGVDNPPLRTIESALRARRSMPWTPGQPPGDTTPILPPTPTPPTTDQGFWKGVGTVVLILGGMYLSFLVVSSFTRRAAQRVRT